MKRNLLNLLILITLMGLITGCGKQPDSLPAVPNTESSGMIETESDQDTTTEIVYDARTQTLSIQGVQDYAELSLPAEVKEARVLQVKDDAFTLSAYLPVLREADLDEQSELPEIIDRTALSLRFLKQYLYENAGSAYPDALIKIPVYFTIDRTVFGYRTDDEQITLQYNDAGTHREFLYLLALMNSNAIGWEQIGYAWYVGTCIDPYSEMPDTILIVPELPYYSQCIAGGIDPAQMSASDLNRSASFASDRKALRRPSEQTFRAHLTHGKPGSNKHILPNKMLIYEKVTGILKEYPRGHVMYCMQKSLCYGLLQIPVC